MCSLCVEKCYNQDMKILLMEDDAVLSDILLDFLRESWEVDYAYNGEDVYALLETNHYDLFVFDINVSGKDGLEVLKELRSFNNTTPAIIITAYIDTKYLKKAFSVGAQDYIKKPFDLDELYARIINIKKIFNIDTSQAIYLSDRVSFIPSQKKILCDGQERFLSDKDTHILHYFIKNATRVISNEELTQNIWEFDSIPSDATIRSHIRTIRDTIGKEKLQTIRGEGYKYE